MTPEFLVFLAAQRAYGFMKGCSFDARLSDPEEASQVLSNIQSGLAQEAKHLEAALEKMNKHLMEPEQ